jgi:hypothetical protein
VRADEEVGMSEMVPEGAMLPHAPLLEVGWASMNMTVFEVTPPIVIVTGTGVLVGVVAGTSASTSYSPAEPGIKAENWTVASTPPIITVGVVVVSAIGLLGAGEPLGG